jgi:hypothetical protein
MALSETQRHTATPFHRQITSQVLDLRRSLSPGGGRLDCLYVAASETARRRRRRRPSVAAAAGDRRHGGDDQPHTPVMLKGF